MSFIGFEAREGQHAIDTLMDAVLKVVQKEELVRYGCPLNRLNQEMSPVDGDFEAVINTIYKHIKHKIVLLLKKSNSVFTAKSKIIEVYLNC